MDVLRKAQEAIDVLQSLIDSGKDDGNLAIVIVHDECPINVIETKEEPELTGPDGVRRNDLCDPEGDLLDKFLWNIEYYLTEGADENGFFRPSATDVEVRMSVSNICDCNDSAWRSPDIREAFYEELPNIVKLYASVGWEVTFEGDETVDEAKREGMLVFKGKVTPSSYRKLSESLQLTTPDGVKREQTVTEERDLLDVYVTRIEECLTGGYDDPECVSRPSAGTVRVSVSICAITGEDFEPDPEEARDAFAQEIPNLVKLYEKAGWHVICSDDLEHGKMTFMGEVTPSSYRKILEGSDSSEEVTLTSPDALLK